MPPRIWTRGPPGPGVVVYFFDLPLSCYTVTLRGVTRCRYRCLVKPAVIDYGISPRHTDPQKQHKKRPPRKTRQSTLLERSDVDRARPQPSTTNPLLEPLFAAFSSR